MKPELDESAWPIVVVRWPRELSLADIDAHFADIRDLGARGERMALILDMSESGVLSHMQRRHAAAHLAGLYQSIGEQIAGVAHVITSPVVRGMLASVYWLAPPPFETRVVGTVAEAVAWARVRIGSGEPAGPEPRS